jgi:hypothetical protein
MVAVDVLKASSIGFALFVEYQAGQPSNYNLTKTYYVEGEEAYTVTLIVSKSGDLLKVKLFRLDRKGDQLEGMTEVTRLPATIDALYQKDAVRIGYSGRDILR